MNSIDKGLISMRISYNTQNDLGLQKALNDLVRYGCSADEIYENCLSLEMAQDIRRRLKELGLKPVVIS